MYCEIVTGQQIIDSIKRKAFHEEIADLVEIEVPSASRFLVLTMPSELMFVVVNLDRVSFGRSAEHLFYSEVKEMQSIVDSGLSDHFKKIYINEEGFVKAQMGKDGPLIPFSAPFNNFRQDPGSANTLIKYLDVCWPEVKSKIREAISPLNLYLLVFDVSRSCSVFVLSESSEIPKP